MVLGLITKLFYVGEFVLTALDEAWFGDIFVFGDFFAIYRNGVAAEELTSFAFAAGELGCYEDVYKLLTFICSREAFGKEFAVVIIELSKILIFCKEEVAELCGAVCGFFAMNNSGDAAA